MVMMSIMPLLFSLVLLLAPSFSYADYYRYLSAEELKKMADTGKVVIVDARTEKEFREGHIPKAINVPPDKTNNIGQLLPKNRKAAVVFYCRGAG